MNEIILLDLWVIFLNRVNENITVVRKMILPNVLIFYILGLVEE